MKKNILISLTVITLSFPSLAFFNKDGNFESPWEITKNLFKAEQKLSGEIVEGYDVAYMYDATSGYTNKSWMKLIPANTPIWQLSIPGTHNSLTVFGGDEKQTQTMNIINQLESGIRYLDVSFLFFNRRFIAEDAGLLLELDLNDFLSDIAYFLNANPSETVLIRLKTKSRGMLETNQANQKFIEILSKYRNSHFIPKGNNFLLGEARGKFVLITDSGTPSSAGMPLSNFFVQDYHNLKDNRDLENKWYKVRKHFIDLQKTKGKISINYLSGGGKAFPYFVASGKDGHNTNSNQLFTGIRTPIPSIMPDFLRKDCFGGFGQSCPIYYVGTNQLTINWLKSNQAGTHLGIVVADFPGAKLINNVIANNKKLLLFRNLDENTEHEDMRSITANPIQKSGSGSSSSYLDFSNLRPPGFPTGGPFPNPWDTLNNFGQQHSNQSEDKKDTSSPPKKPTIGGIFGGGFSGSFNGNFEDYFNDLKNKFPTGNSDSEDTDETITGSAVAVTIYSDSGYSGKSMEISKDTPFLNSMNDKMSSYQVNPGYTVRFFVHGNYQGNYYTRGSNSDDESFTKDFNDTISSIKIISSPKTNNPFNKPQFGKSNTSPDTENQPVTEPKDGNSGSSDAMPAVVIYDDMNQRGKSLAITKDMPSLNHMNNKMSSFKVMKGFTVRFFTDFNYKGSYYTRSFSLGGQNAAGFNDRIRSIKIIASPKPSPEPENNESLGSGFHPPGFGNIGHGAILTIYEHGNYQGRKQSYNSDSTFLGNMNDMMSSYKIKPGYKVVFFIDGNFKGKSFSRDSNSADSHFTREFNDKISSFKIYRK